MSKAFTKEDDCPVERAVRVAMRPGLPPAAPNLITEEGFKHLQREREKVRGDGAERAAEVDAILASTTLVKRTAGAPDCVVFGTRVTFRNETGVTMRRRIAGVDELGCDPENLSWVSPLARALLGAEPGQRVRWDSGDGVELLVVERIEF